MKTFLLVPFSEKEKAKKLGAKWDYVHKRWYWEGLVTKEIQKFLPTKKSFEERKKEALKRFEQGKKDLNK